MESYHKSNFPGYCCSINDTEFVRKKYTDSLPAYARIISVCMIIERNSASCGGGIQLRNGNFVINE